MGLVHTGKVAAKAAVVGSRTTSTYGALATAVGNGSVGTTLGTALTASSTVAGDIAAMRAAASSLTSLRTTAVNNLAAATGTGASLSSLATLQGVIDGLDDDLAALADAEAALGAADAVAAVDAKTVFDNRFTVNVDGSVETSSGLTFGARLRIRSNDGELASVNGARVYMKSGAIEVAVGNIYGALDSMPGMYNSEVGLTALSDAGVVAASVTNGWGYDGYASTGSQMGVEAIYSAGGFTGHLSVTDSDAGSATNRVAAVGSYVAGDWTVALGVQDSEVNTEDKTVLTVGGKVGDFGVGFAAADNDGVQKIALNGSATFGATTVNGFVADDESGTDTAYGLGVSHDLGGAALMAGVERDAVGQTRADMGVSFSF